MMMDFGPAAPVVTLGIVALVFGAFFLERFPPSTVAFGGAALMLALGLIQSRDLLAAIGNPAPVTIAMMFILTAALLRTGALDAASWRLRALAVKRPRQALLGFMGAAAAASAFMNNTPVVMVLIPVATALARAIDTKPSGLLIPLSYMVILGGTCTLIGTSTNLLVDGVGRDLGLAPFGMFEIAPLGLIVAAGGALFLAIAGKHLLPAHTTVTSRGIERQARNYLVELFVPSNSPLIGQRALDLDMVRSGAARLVDVIRGDASLRRSMGEIHLEVGDRIVLRGRDIETMGLHPGTEGGLAPKRLEPAGARASVVMEVMVGPNSRVLGRALGSLRWRRRYGVYPVALHREATNLEGSLEKVPLEVGDTLLIDGSIEDLGRLVEDTRLTNLSILPFRPFRRDKAPIAIGALAAVVVLAALGVESILTLSVLGVAVVLLTGCIDAEEAFEAIDARLMVLIVSMLALGGGLSSTGALDLLVGYLKPLMAGLSPIITLMILYALTSLLTELVTNNAVAVVMTPIAVALATQLGFDPRPFVVAVMFGASASFATPIGYQTNTLVYAAGGYRFRDFLVIGVPMNIIVGLITCVTIPLIWSF